MAHLEAVVLHRRDDRADALQLAVGEDVAVDEPPGSRALAVRGPGDGVVEQPALRPQLARQEAEVGPRLRAPMCSVRPIEETASKPDSAHVAVVEEANLGAVLEPALGDRPLRPVGLWRESVTPRALTP